MPRRSRIWHHVSQSNDAVGLLEHALYHTKSLYPKPPGPLPTCRTPGLLHPKSFTVSTVRLSHPNPLATSRPPPPPSRPLGPWATGPWAPAVPGASRHVSRRQRGAGAQRGGHAEEAQPRRGAVGLRRDIWWLFSGFHPVPRFYEGHWTTGTAVPRSKQTFAAARTRPVISGYNEF